MRKTLSLFLFIVFVLSLSACGLKTHSNKVILPDFEKTPGEKNSWEYDNEPFDFTWYVNVSWFNWTTNGSDLVSKVLYEKTGAKIKIITPVTDDGQMLSTMISGNKLPDVISIQSWYPQVSQLANQGYVYPLNDLIDKWAPSFNSRLQQDVWDWFKQSDGKTYGVPNFAYSSKYVSKDEKLEPNGAILVREDWYQETVDANIDMTTPEGFIQGCKYIKDKYGDKFVIPIQLDNFDSEGNPSIKWLSQYFSVPFETTSGDYIYQITEPRYLEMLEFINEAYREQLIKESNFSANSEQVRAALASGKVFVSMVTPQDFNQAFLSNKNNGITYIPLVLRNKDKEAPVLQDIRGMGFLLSMITTNAKRPDKIIKVFDYLYSEEGQRLVAFGVEGKTWEWENNEKTKIKWTYEYLKEFVNNDTGKYGLYQMNLLMNLAYINKLKPSNGKTADDIYLENLKKPLSPYSYDYTPFFLKQDTTSKNYFSFTNKKTRVTNTWGEWLPDIIRANSKQDLLNKYNQAIEEMNRKGLQDVIKFDNQSYQRAKDAINVKNGWPTYRSDYVSPVTGPNGDFSYWKDAVYDGNK